MLSEICLKFGAHPDAPGLSFDPGAVTVLVGPNNSGKSLLLREIDEAIELVTDSKSSLILDKILAKTLEAQDADDLISRGEPAGPGAATYKAPGRKSAGPRQFEHNQLRAAATEPKASDLRIAAFAWYWSMRLDGNSRLQLASHASLSDVLRPQNFLARLFVDEAAKEQFRAVCFSAFGRHVSFDPTQVGMIKLRFADSYPPPEAENTIGQIARDFQERATPIQELSDGVRAFCGIAAAVLSGNFRLITIDEAEAFLHPPLARQLGRLLADTSADRGGTVIAATHSSEFLIGCVQSRRPINVVRLTYESATPRARLLASSDLSRMMRDPFLRSAGVLNALFHRGAIVCEDDSDRAFYQEINERLLEAGRPAINSGCFLNAHGNAGLHRLAGPLRDMGVPAAIIGDLDCLGHIKGVVKACGAPEAVRRNWGGMARATLDAFAKAERSPKEGLRVLPAGDRQAAETLLEGLQRFGVFLTPVGELEMWLPELGASGHGPAWMAEMFTLLGSDPGGAGYVRPAPGDVWTFVESIEEWIADPDRFGMPV